ncbi:MAG TPA: cell division protein FtsZ, partial [Rhodospirillales bacterium]|nr:cell division protein FtsZ [Rhodospirillales bacterium]
ATTTFANAFVMADEVLHDAIRGITDLIVLPGLINLDFADVRAVITQTGRAMMGSGIANGASRAINAAEAAIANPLLDIVSIKGAQGLLINVTGGPDMTLFEVDEAANRIRNEVGGDSLVIFGSAFDPALDGNLRVSIVATGLSVPPQPEPEPVMAAAIEHASEEPEQTSMPLPDTELEIETDRITVDFSEDETHPIPSPTIPLPQNPRPAETATAQPKPEPASDENLQSTMEEPATDEEESPEKDKPRLGWAEKFFRS